MLPDLIVVANPSLRQHLSFKRGAKHLSLKGFSSRMSVEAFDRAVSSRLSASC
jgi:hypothetical protein